MAYKYLVIVESPTKAKTIDKYLGRNYKVVASKGHLRDLPKSKMGVDIENNFEPHYISIRGRGDTIKELRKLAGKAEKVYLASDPDREGEAIAWHLAYLLNLDDQDLNRVAFNEITKESVKEAFKQPRQIDQDLVDAQQARRILDRIVGYSISPILWKKIKGGLSAGRVQSTALKIIIDREQEIRDFKPEEYWTLPAIFKKGRSKFEAEFYGLNGDKTDLPNQAAVDQVLSQIDQEGDFTVDQIEEKERRRKPYLPYTTSTLQQDAANRLNFRAGKTMMVAQQLYEGIKIKNSTVGLITYMRTDSTRISANARQMAEGYIKDHYGAAYLGAGRQGAKASGAQDAHEAVRPSNVNLAPESIKDALTRDQYRLYSLIWARFLASQMSDAVFDTIRVDLSQGPVGFKANGSRIKFDGFLKVYPSKTDKDNYLPDLAIGDTVKPAQPIEGDQHFTQPPARYTEASLVKTLEELGIGRPSTYAPTIETLRKRYYVRMEAKRFEPTELGEIVNGVMEGYFPDIVNTEFTAGMEDHLDQVEAGKEEWKQVLSDYYQVLDKDLKQAESQIEAIEIKDEPAGFDCPECGHPMVIKIGRYGKFYACSNFPDCRHTQAIVKEIGVPCPECGKGQVVERKSKKNRNFFGCSRYPDCEFVSWDKPVGRQCPKCDHYLIEKVSRKGRQVKCSHCDYQEALQA